MAPLGDAREETADLTRRRGPFVDLGMTSGRLRIEVHDPEQRVPVLSTRIPDATTDSGRGLVIVDALADGWGVHAQPQGRGKTVWFELDVAEPAQVARPACPRPCASARVPE